MSAAELLRARQQLQMAIAELEAFDRTWDGATFSTKQWERMQLVSAVEEARLAYIRAVHAQELAEPGESPVAVSGEQRRVDAADTWLQSKSPPAKITDEARAEYLDVSARTIRKWRSEGRIS